MDDNFDLLGLWVVLGGVLGVDDNFDLLGLWVVFGRDDLFRCALSVNIWNLVFINGHNLINPAELIITKRMASDSI